MSKYPVQVNYSFEVDLDIAESQLSSVKTSILTNNLIEEEIDFNIYPEVNHYKDTFYIYGDGELLAVTGRQWVRDFYPQEGNASIPEGSDWSFKYRQSGGSAPPFGAVVYGLWIDGGIPGHGNSAVPFNDMICWHSGELAMPYKRVRYYSITRYVIRDDEDHFILPYNQITVKRNTGLPNATVQALNPLYDIPSNTTFPNLRVTIPNMTMATPTGNIGNLVNRQGSKWINESKLWIKLGKEKYRLKIKGYFFKWTDKQTRTDTEYYANTYTVGTYNFTPFYEDPYMNESGLATFYDSYYIPAGHSETTDNEIIVQEATYNPIDIKLLVNYVNNRGHNEVRNYTP